MMARLLFVILLTVFSAVNLGTACAVEPDGRPTVGLVLGGGAAKGLSHVGVLKVLEENQIPVDVIAGTSIGAVVGSLYAAGYSADEIDEIATKLDWREVFNDDPARGRALFRRKSEDFGFLTDFKITFSDGKLVLPVGLIEGQALYLELSRLLTRAYMVDSFNDLPRPFRAVATNLSNGTPVVFDNGNLVSAVFGSMAIPGFIPPVERGDVIVIDGAFSNNLPMNVARDMGADILIIVDLGADPRPAEELANVVEVIRQLQILLTIGNSNLQRATITPNDIYIEPDLKDVSITGFDKTELSIERGTEAAMKALPSLRKLALGDAEWAAYKRRHHVAAPEAPMIARVEIDQDTQLSDEILRTGLSIKPGDQLDVSQLNADINALYDDGVFNRIKYEIQQKDGENVLLVSASAKESADGFFRFGVAMDSNFEDESAFKLGVSYTKPQINTWGAEFRTEFIFGESTNAIAEFYQPVGARQDIFVEPSIFFGRQKDDFFDETGRRRGRITATQYGGALAAGKLFGRWGELRGGIDRSRINIDLSDRTLPFTDVNVDDSSLFARFTVDTLDDLSFPRHGEILIAEYSVHDSFLGGDAEYEQYTLTALKPITSGRHTVILNGEFSGSKGEAANLIGTSNLGGLFSLSGFSSDELSGRYAVLMGGTYLYRVNQEAPLFDAPLFVGGSTELGNVYQRFDDINFDDVVYAGSIFAGLDSPIGPVFLGVGFNDEGRQSLYFKIGSFF